MAQLKSLLVSGPTRLIGDSFANKIELTSISAPTSSGGTTYGLGSNGQVLKSNGSSVYWTSLGTMATETASNYILKSTLSGAFDIMYSSAANTPTRLAANTTSTKKFLRMTGTGSAGTAPAWDTVTKTDVGLSNVENTKLSTWAGSSNITTIGTLSSGTVPWARLSNVPSASTSTAGIIQIGTGATNAAAGNHTHTTSLATDTGTATVTLAHNTTYKLTAGGTSVIFKMPSDNNTDTKVTQGTTTTESWRKILLNGGSGTIYSAWDTAVGDDVTDIAYRTFGVAVQPSTNTLKATNLEADKTVKVGTFTIGGNTDELTKTISSSSTIYVDRTNASVIFKYNGTNKIWIDTNNYLRPETDNTLQLGDSSHRWNKIYGTNIYGTLSGTATNANYLNLYEARATTITLNKSANYIGAGKMFHLVASSSTSSTDNGKPPMGDANILQMNWDNNGGYDAQLGISTVHTDASPARMEFRSQISNKTAWREVVTSTPGTAAGGTTQPIYISASGVATATTYALNKTVPSNAEFTDTKNTAGSTDTTSKIFLIGATSQAASAQTYSDSEIYVTNGTLYVVKSTDASGTGNNKPALIVGGADTTAHLEFDANEIMAKSNGTTTAPLYLNHDGGLVYANQKKVVRLTSDPTSGQVMIADGTDGQIKSSGYTLAQSVTSSSKLTDENVKQTAITDHSTSAEYHIILSGSTNDTTETKGVNKDTNLKFNTGTQLLSIGGSISATGNLTITGNANLNNETYADSITAGSLLVNGNANFTQIPTAPTPAATSNDTSVATTAFVMNAFTANDAMVFKGVINANSALPATHYAGWTYRIGTAGTYANKTCEVGDIIICVTDGTSANNDHWAVIQNNIDGAVYRGTNAFTDANIIIADSTNGKVKSSGKTLTTTAPASGSGDTTIPTSKAVWSAISGASGYGKTGTVTSITPGNGLLNGTGTSAITTSGTLNINYGTSASAVSTTAAAGSANTVSRSDHVHSISVVNNNINLSRNTETTIATIAGTAIKIKLPASDNTDTKVNVVKRGTTKSYILGDTTAPPDSAAAHTAVAESYIYMTSTAGQMSAKSYSFNDGASTPTEKAQIIYNTTTGCLEIIVA